MQQLPTLYKRAVTGKARPDLHGPDAPWRTEEATLKRAGFSYRKASNR